jgi:adenylyltransferase/sulfurtransferase
MGLGGLGCPAAVALARAGVQRMTLVDPDRVELSNLHRQLLHRTSSLGRFKVDSAAEALQRAFPQLSLTVLPVRVGATNAERLFQAHDVVLDATDGIDVKLLLSDVAVRTGTPLVHAGVLRTSGMALLIRPHGPCLRCLFREAPDEDAAPTCARAGVLGSVAGVMGALQAALAIRALQRAGSFPRGASAETLHRFDAEALAYREVRLERDPECPSCSRAGEAFASGPEVRP